jgi:thioredoxin reductase
MSLSRRGHLNSRNRFRPIQATGGVVSEITVAGVRYRLHSFLAVGTHSFVVLDPGNEGLIHYLVVGGGGGGGAAHAGGGGGGGVVMATAVPIGVGSHSLVVGAGGIGPYGTMQAGSDGQVSSFLGETALRLAQLFAQARAQRQVLAQELDIVKAQLGQRTVRSPFDGVVAERFGGQVLDTLAIENFISVSETEGPKFAAALEQHVRQYDVDIMNTQRAVKLTPADKPGGFAEVTLANGAVLKGRSVILSTGARWRNVNVPGEQEYKNKGVAYCPHCDGPLFKGKRVAVIGGGNSGVEAAIDLAGLVSHVTLLEFASELKADAVLVRKLQSLPNATIVTNAQTTEITGDGQKVNGLRYKSRVDGVEHTVALEGVFVQIGLVPNTEWLDGALERNRFGEIVVDARGQTSAEGVFAAGDATTTPYKQIIIATGDGAKAALSAFDHLIRVPLAEAA